MGRTLPLSSVSSIFARRFIANPPGRTPTNRTRKRASLGIDRLCLNNVNKSRGFHRVIKDKGLQGPENGQSIESVEIEEGARAKHVSLSAAKPTRLQSTATNEIAHYPVGKSSSSLTSTSAFTSQSSHSSAIPITQFQSRVQSNSAPAPRERLTDPESTQSSANLRPTASSAKSSGRIPLLSSLDQLGISLAFPFSELAVLSISAVLRFRHTLSNSNIHAHSNFINPSAQIQTTAENLIPDLEATQPPLTSTLRLSSASSTESTSTAPAPAIPAAETRASIRSNMIVTEEKGVSKLSEISAESGSSPTETSIPQTPASFTTTETSTTAAHTGAPPSYSQVISQTGSIATSSKWASAARSSQAPSSPTGDRDFSNINSAGNVVPPASNYVHVFRRDGSIRGVWNINPGLEIPQAFLANQEEARNVNKSFFKKECDQKEAVPWDVRPSLTLHTRDGRISAQVWVTDSQEEDAGNNEKKKYTSMDLNSRDGSVLLCVRTHGTRPLKIKMHTNDGDIRLFLPRSFVGPITHNIRDGKVVFSPGMQPSATSFSMVEGKSGTSFLGDWKAATQGNQAALEQWEGDRCDLTTKDGSVYLFWEDEFEEFSNRKGKWLRNIFQMD